MIPTVGFLEQIIPGLNDYRYLTTLQRLIKENESSSPAAAAAQKIYDDQLNLVAGKDRPEPGRPAKLDADRQVVVQAILSLGPGPQECKRLPRYCAKNMTLVV